MCSLSFVLQKKEKNQDFVSNAQMYFPKKIKVYSKSLQWTDRKQTNVPKCALAQIPVPVGVILAIEVSEIPVLGKTWDLNPYCVNKSLPEKSDSFNALWGAPGHALRRLITTLCSL